MLKITVPTPTTLLVPPTSAGGLALALIRKTSRSGRLNGTSGLQSCAVCPSSQWLLAGLKPTIRPVCGGFGVEPGGNGGRVRPTVLPSTASSLMVVVRLPDLKAAA